MMKMPEDGGWWMVEAPQRYLHRSPFRLHIFNKFPIDDLNLNV